MKASRTMLVGVALVIFAGTIWLHWPSVQGDFLYGDDVEYLRQSARWNGLTWDAVKWAFTSTDSYYHPLVRLSHILDYQIWGRNAEGHHATGVVVHALNAALVFGFLWTLLGATVLATGERLAVALWVAVVFAIHPLQVESAAWISGRTQLLCTTFGIGCLWAYAAGGRRWVEWGLFVGAVLCKPMAVSFPFVMLAMDYYPLRRHEQFGWGRLLWEKSALIALAAAASLATLVTKSQLGQISPLATISLSARVFLAFESLTFYLLKLVWPYHLSYYYPTRLLSLDQWPVLASVITVYFITTVAVFERRRMPMLVAAWSAYVMLVLPVSGLVSLGSQVVAQRYAYMAMLPVLLLAGAAGIWLWRRSARAAHLALIGLVTGQLYLFGARTRHLIPDWRNDETVRRAAFVENPDSEKMNEDLATMLLDQGKASEALEYAQRGVEIAPEQSFSHLVLGRVLAHLGRLQESIGQDEQALRCEPDSAEAHYVFGTDLMDLGKVSEAVEHYEQALRIKPDYAEAHCNLGIALFKLGQTTEAVAQYQEALRLNPDLADAHNNLGAALYQTGKSEEAIEHFRQALRLNPDLADAHNNLGAALYQNGKSEEAIEHYRQALRIKPDYAEAHLNLGLALEKLGRTSGAIEHYEQALKLRPDFVRARDALARLQAGQ
jgi:protein O-mannosyl-transferase